MSAASKLAKMPVPDGWGRQNFYDYAVRMARSHEQHAKEWRQVADMISHGATAGAKSHHRRKP